MNGSAFYFTLIFNQEILSELKCLQSFSDKGCPIKVLLCSCVIDLISSINCFETLSHPKRCSAITVAENLPKYQSILAFQRSLRIQPNYLGLNEILEVKLHKKRS